MAFAGEHCHPSFYSTGHGAFLTGRTAAQFFLSASARAQREQGEREDVYNLGAASVADLSSWLQEIQMGEKSLDDYRSETSSVVSSSGGGNKKRGRTGAKRGTGRPSRDDGKYITPR